MLQSRTFTVVLVLVFLLALNGGTPVRPTAISPRLTLWAWERPEQLNFLPPGDVGVAFLAGTVYLDDEPATRLRAQPLRVNTETPLTAVVRLEVTPSAPTEFTDEYRAAVVRQILHAVDLPRVGAVQIDFDATRSQRPFYRELLRDLHGQLPSGRALSITALASWCLGDDWMVGLPIDEAIPMLFRMGMDRANIVSALDGGRDFREPLCRSSIGISTDEPWPGPLLDRRVYVFDPRPWNPASFTAVERKLAQ
jgi:hypothetical protein